MSFTLRQWHTDAGEPAPDPSIQQTSVVHREALGPWTFEVRSEDAEFVATLTCIDNSGSRRGPADLGRL
ncbi:hypothetical protein [Nocardia grenadensis]